jgi:hypothetical protein
MTTPAKDAELFYVRLFLEAVIKEQEEGKVKFLMPSYNGKKLFHDYNAFKAWLEAVGFLERK